MKTPIRIRTTPVVITLLVIAALLALTLIEAARSTGGTGGTTKTSAAVSASVDPGTPLSGPAPNFKLTDQFGKRVSLSSFHGKVVLLAFNDAECTTVCPLTTTAMVDAKRMLGAAGSHVALLGVDANPDATSLKDVRSYSELHGMTHLWDFTTGSLPQLKQVWRDYHIAVDIEQGQIDHTPALFAIGAQGKLARLYLTQMAYSSVTQQAQMLAHEASRLLPSHPRVRSRLTYRRVPTIPPTQHMSLPEAGGGTLALGPGKARLLLFFASWDAQVTDLSHELEALGGYAKTAGAEKLPQLVAVDEGSVEPSPSALEHLLSSLPAPLPYPVGIDRSGRVADGYGVQDEPWLVLVSASGKPLWYYDVSTRGWLSQAALGKQLRAALSRASSSVKPGATRSELAGSPAPLASLHSQAGQLLGGESALAARIRALRGYPIVLNVWASWCAPCRAEFGLLASAAARYGKRVAFLGADVSDNSSDARAFLSQHPVSYPSYPVTIDQLSKILPQGLLGTPSTIYFNRAGKQTEAHTGQYDSQGTLDSDVTSYALHP